MADEDDPVAAAAMRRVAEMGGVVPQIWWYELRNALLVNERRGRITAQQVSDTLADSLALGMEIAQEHEEATILGFARHYGLTVYDSAYLEVAFRRGLPLATLDRRLSEAAADIGIAVVGIQT